MFYGEYEHTIDKKGRLIIPANFRETLKENYVEKFYIVKGLDKCLFVFTEEEWKRQEQKLRGLPFTRRKSRSFNRVFFSGTYEAICDKQGRILLPQKLKDFAGISKRVIITGLSNYFEIWDSQTWREVYEEAKEGYEDIAEGLFNED